MFYNFYMWVTQSNISWNFIQELKIRTKLTPKNSFGSRLSIGDLALAIIVPSILGSDPYVNCNAQLKTRIINFFMTILM